MDASRPRIWAAMLVAALAAAAGADDAAVEAARSAAVEAAGPTTALAPGDAGTIVLTIRCAPGVHVQPQAPLAVALAASPGLALARDRLGWADVQDRKAPSPALRVPFTVRAAGPQEVRATLEFFLCSDRWCVKQRREVAVGVAVGGEAPRASPDA